MQIEKKTTFERKYYTGVTQCTVLGANPSIETINKWRNYTPDEEPKEIEYIKSIEYKYKDKEGNDQEETVDQLTIDIWLKDTKTSDLYKTTYYLIQRPATNKAGDKEVWLNQFGMSSYVHNEFELASWFVSKTVKDKHDPSLIQTFDVKYRRAMVGEKDLYNFLAAFVEINNFNVANSLFLENEKDFWKGNLKEINNLFQDFSAQTVLVSLEIKSKEGEDGETKDFQVVNNRIFCPGRFWRNFNSYYAVNFDGLETNKKMYNLNRFVKELKNPESTKNYFILQPAAEYDKNQNPINSNDPIIQEPTSSAY